MLGGWPSAVCAFDVFVYIRTSMFVVHKLRIKKSDVRVLLLHSVEEIGLWSCWTCACKSYWLKGPSLVSCPMGSRIGRDRRQSMSVHSVNKILVLSSMIGAVNVSRMQAMYVWRSKCAYSLSLEQSLREREDHGPRFSCGTSKVWAPWGSVSCQGVQLDSAPSFFGDNVTLKITS
jgi:hypothetical protein